MRKRYIFTNEYKEDKFPKIKPVILSSKLYARSIESFVVDTTDAIIINKKEKLFYLVRRIAKPMQGWWFIGGRRLMGESMIASIVRCFKRETLLLVSPSRFSLIAESDYMWSSRQQRPQEKGSHSFSHIFVIELSSKERDVVGNNLDKKEYNPSFGLRAFNQYLLKSEKIHQSIQDIYREVFLK